MLLHAAEALSCSMGTTGLCSVVITPGANTLPAAGFVDPILRNRRALTIASAVLDVALVLAGIKFFQNVATGGTE